MNSPNYPPPGGPQRPYGQPQGQPYGQQPPPGGQPFGGPPPQGPPYGAPPPQGPGGFGGPGGPGGPAGGPPAGGLGPAGPGGAPPAYPTPPPPPPSAKNKTGLYIKIGLAVVVVAVGVVFAIINWGTSAASANVGDCIKVINASATDAEVEKIDCTSPDAIYKVAVVHDSTSASCPEGDYTEYSQGGRRTSDVTLCLMLNAKEGDCFKVSVTGDDVNRAECAGADVQVLKVLDGAKDDSGCPENTSLPQSYPEPKPVVMCLGAVGATSGT